MSVLIEGWCPDSPAHSELFDGFVKPTEAA